VKEETIVRFPLFSFCYGGEKPPEDVQMAKVKEEVRAEAAKVKAITPKEAEQIDGASTKVVAVFTGIDFRASNGGYGHVKGFVLQDAKKQTILVGETTLTRSFPNAMDEADPQRFGFKERDKLEAMLAQPGVRMLNPCKLLKPGEAKTRPDYAKPKLG